MEVSLTEYQRGYRDAVEGKPFVREEGDEWCRGFHDLLMDVTAQHAVEEANNQDGSDEVYEP